MSETQTETKKSKGGAIGAVIGTLVLAVACAVGGWIANDLWPKGKMVMPQMPKMTATVAVKEVEERAYNLPEKFVAHAEAMQEVDLLPQVDGYIKEIRFREGDIVKAGTVLYVLDDERYQAVANQRKADLEAAEAEARRAERYWERMQKADSRGITQLERDNAEAAFRMLINISVDQIYDELCLFLIRFALPVEDAVHVVVIDADSGMIRT